MAEGGTYFFRALLPVVCNCITAEVAAPRKGNHTAAKIKSEGEENKEEGMEDPERDMEVVMASAPLFA